MILATTYFFWDTQYLRKTYQFHLCHFWLQTYVGDILIAVNPFKQLPIYSMQVSEKYNDLHHKGDMTPHIFGLSDKAYQSMLREQRSQCCIVSGESGAGKTETGKFIVQHLLSRAHSSETLLNEKIEQVGPVDYEITNLRGCPYVRVFFRLKTGSNYCFSYHFTPSNTLYMHVITPWKGKNP